jgi:flavin reductase (DIM6/NTAB) family NADH-FMN oxidoreductase RutF/rubredoxin
MDETALLKLSYGLYVIGVQAAGKLGGCIVDSVAQVSEGKPPVIVIGCNKNSNTNKIIKETGKLTLSVLSENVNPFVIANFGFQSAKNADKWVNVPHAIKDGLPVLDGAVSYIQCKVSNSKDMETHTVFFCDVVDAWNGKNPGKPLIYGEYQRTMKTATSEAFQKFKETGKAPKLGTINLSDAKWECILCSYIYDKNKPFEQLPDDWVCPVCGAGKGSFKKIVS